MGCEARRPRSERTRQRCSACSPKTDQNARDIEDVLGSNSTVSWLVSCCDAPLTRCSLSDRKRKQLLQWPLWLLLQYRRPRQRRLRQLRNPSLNQYHHLSGKNRRRRKHPLGMMSRRRNHRLQRSRTRPLSMSPSQNPQQNRRPSPRQRCPRKRLNSSTPSQNRKHRNRRCLHQHPPPSPLKFCNSS